MITEPTTRNRAHLGAFRKGVKAFQEGKPRSACPYDRWAQTGRHITWERGFATRWMDGYDAAAEEAGAEQVWIVRGHQENWSGVITSSASLIRETAVTPAPLWSPGLGAWVVRAITRDQGIQRVRAHLKQV